MRHELFWHSTVLLWCWENTIPLGVKKVTGTEIGCKRGRKERGKREEELGSSKRMERRERTDGTKEKGAHVLGL